MSDLDLSGPTFELLFERAGLPGFNLPAVQFEGDRGGHCGRLSVLGFDGNAHGCVLRLFLRSPCDGSPGAAGGRAVTLNPPEST